MQLESNAGPVDVISFHGKYPLSGQSSINVGWICTALIICVLKLPAGTTSEVGRRNICRRQTDKQADQSLKKKKASHK